MSGPAVAFSRVLAPRLFGVDRRPLTDVNAKVRVLVVDGHPLLRAGVAAVLKGTPDLTIVGEASDGREALERFRALQPDVTVMDFQTQGMCGIDDMRGIRDIK